MDKPLQRIDHLMWDAEAPNSLVTIAGMMLFKKPINKEKLIQIIEDRLMRFERFGKKVIFLDGSPRWHKDEQFQLQTHMHHIALPGRGGYKELQRCISDLISQPLNYNKPLWDIHLIDNYEGGYVLLWRLHHAIGDGMGLVKVIYSLTGTTANSSLSAVDETVPDHKKVSELSQLAEIGKGVYEDVKHLIQNPALLRDSLENSWKTALELKELFFGKSVKDTIYKGKLGLTKKAAWTDPLPLELFKKLAKQHNAKINDVLLALVAGAIRKHLLLHGQKTESDLKIIAPVNIRKATEVNILHNEFSFISLDLPVHIASFKKRIDVIREKTAALKPSIEPFFINELLHFVADYTPMVAKQLLLEFMGKHIMGVVTNVPGPSHPIYLAGNKVEDLMFWVPHTMPLGIGISLMSYNGKVYMGIVTDDKLVNDPDKIVNAFTSELSRLGKLVV